MRKFTWVLFAAALIFGYLPVKAETPEVGRKAPPFSLKMLDGHPVSLGEMTHKGMVALIVLRGYPGYQCPFCTTQVHDVIENADKFAAAGTEVLLIYPGPPADLDQRAKEFLVKQNPLPANVHLVIDPDYTFTNRYGLRWNAPKETAYPSTFLIDRNDVVFFRKISKAHGDRTTSADLLAELQKAKSTS